jgi:hypothetical protein
MLNKPARPFVTFKNIGKPLYLNFITIEDEDYFNEKYPDDTIMNRMQEGDVNTVLDIFWKWLVWWGL